MYSYWYDEIDKYWKIAHSNSLLQPSPTDPKHVPDIVSGHASSVFDSSRVTVLTNQKADQSIDSEMAPPSRPPRKSKKHYTCNDRETEVSDVQWYI